MIIENTTTFTLQNREMFTAIAPRYDFLNWLLSVGQDKYWRKQAVDLLDPIRRDHILDVATGTCDIVIEIAKRNLAVRIFGIDFSQRMLELGKAKVSRNNYDKSISFQIGSGEHLPFANESFDGVVCAFGIRNFANVKRGLREFYRVLKPGGRIVILEFSVPQNQFLNAVYECYFNFILPKIGNLVSGHSNAYTYLPESVAHFPNQKTFVEWIEKTGFKKVSFEELTFGIVSIHRGFKVANEECEKTLPFF
jgi:demethylmenaquinone methyltransferase/2-methoxy-6-polyprenyl-1,4-benzoquinol methylase